MQVTLPESRVFPKLVRPTTTYPALHSHCCIRFSVPVGFGSIKLVHSCRFCKNLHKSCQNTIKARCMAFNTKRRWSESCSWVKNKIHTFDRFQWGLQPYSLPGCSDLQIKPKYADPRSWRHKVTKLKVPICVPRGVQSKVVRVHETCWCWWRIRYREDIKLPTTRLKRNWKLMNKREARVAGWER